MVVIRVGISLFLAGSGVQNLWVNGVQNSCVKVQPVKCHGNPNDLDGCTLTQELCTPLTQTFCVPLPSKQVKFQP